MLQGYEKHIWTGLLGMMLLVALWFTGSTLYHLYGYFSLSASTYAKTTVWTVKEISDERYLMQSDYQFEVKGEKFTGHTLLDSPTFRNDWAAEQAIPEYSTKQWKVWYKPSNPQYSTLQKNFSIKECVSSILLWGVLLYFIWLRYYYVPSMNRKS